MTVPDVRIYRCFVFAKGVSVVESADSVPQYGRSSLSRAVVTRPRSVTRNKDGGGLTHETVERKTLVRWL